MAATWPVYAHQPPAVYSRSIDSHWFITAYATASSHAKLKVGDDPLGAGVLREAHVSPL